MSVVTFSINAVDKTRAAFLSVQGGIDRLSRSTTVFQGKMAKALVGGSIFAVLAREIRDVAQNIESIPGVPQDTISSVMEMNAAFKGARNVVQQWVAELLGGFATAAKSIGMFVGAIEWKRLLNPLTAVKAISEAMIRVQDALDAETADHVATLKEQTAAEMELFTATRNTKAALEAKNAALKEAERLARKGLAAMEFFEKANRDFIASLAAEGEAIRKSVRTPMEEYGETVNNLRMAFNNGAIDAQTFGRAVAMASDKMDDQLAKLNKMPDELSKVKTGAEVFGESMAQMWNNVSDRAGQAFADMVLTGEASFSELANIISRTMLEIVARMAIINPLMNMMFGLTGTSALPSFFGGGKADGGPVSTGKTFLVGENGPELFTPSQAGRIIPNHAMSSGGGGGDTYNIDARSADRAGFIRLEQMIKTLNGSIEQRAVSATNDFRIRGITA